MVLGPAASTNAVFIEPPDQSARIYTSAMDPTLLVPLVVVAVIFGILRFLSRPHTVIRIASGQASLVRGAPPSGMLADLMEVAAHVPAAEGRVELKGAGSKLELETPGLDDTVEQRVRNVIQLYRDRIR
jgi:hypothetical protein